MLHLFLISHLIVVVSCNPFHKYPYVFLLDVGNEEIEKFNTQQYRLSIPGGSLAMRYPAVGEGDTIGHVRVSGIDFGTDLKASIIQGGPGYKYAVFVFMGNPGVPYDAVVTIQTIPSIDTSVPTLNSKSSNENTLDLEDSNDSSEDVSDDTATNTVYSGNVKSQVMQSSSNIYQYTSNNAADNDDFKNKVDTHDYDFQDVKRVFDNEADDDYGDAEKSQSVLKSVYSESSADDARVVNMNRNQNGIYEAFKPHWYGGVRFYPQAALYTQDGYEKQVYDASDYDEKEEFNDVIGENSYKNDEIKNNYGSPVEYKK